MVARARNEQRLFRGALSRSVKVVRVKTLSMQEVKGNSDRMLVKDVFVNLEAKTGRRFTRDACCDDKAANALCAAVADLYLSAVVSAMSFYTFVITASITSELSPSLGLKVHRHVLDQHPVRFRFHFSHR